MALVGRKPKPPGQAVNRNKSVHEWAEVPDVPFVGPKMPKRSDGRVWSARTRRWWVVVSSMPHCVLWSASDWDYAETTAGIAAEVHEGNWRAATELRNREKTLGTTLDFRRDLRIRYVTADQGNDAPEVTRLDDYRDL